VGRIHVQDVAVTRQSNSAARMRGKLPL
jgi:hypothetical protein